MCCEYAAYQTHGRLEMDVNLWESWWTVTSSSTVCTENTLKKVEKKEEGIAGSGRKLKAYVII